MDFSEIIAMAERKKILKLELAQACDMTPNGFISAITKGTLKVVSLERISEALGVSPAYWWKTDSYGAMEQEQTYSLSGKSGFVTMLQHKEEKKAWESERAFLRSQIEFMKNVIERALPELEKAKK